MKPFYNNLCVATSVYSNPPGVISSGGDEKRKNGFINKPKSEIKESKPSPTTNQSSSSLTNGSLPNGEVTKIRPPQRKFGEESFEQCSLWDAFCTYLCYAVLVLTGYVNDILRPRTTKEKNRDGYVPLYASFESFYTRHVYRRVADCWNMPVASVPGKYITLLERYTKVEDNIRYPSNPLLERESKDYGWSFEMTGKKVNCINLGSYNYLGFAENHGTCAEAAIKTLRDCGVGTCSTRMEMGNSGLLRELDQLVARFVGAEDAITCAMGFATNSMNIPAIFNKECLVLSDEKNHASIILGLRLSRATIRVFKHNNMKSLEKRIREGIVSGQPRTHLPWEKIIVVVEGVYSMEGSIVKLPEIIALKRKYGIYIYLDEAHSIGAMGPNGRGVVDYWGSDPKDVDVLMGTFTKSFGSAGGYIAGSKQLIDLLRRKSHAHAYGTAMSPAVIQQILTSMKIIMGEDGTDEGIKRIRQLKRNSRYFRQQLKQRGFITYGNEDSPVIPCALYMPTKIAYVVREMVKRGVATVGVGFPATPLVEGRTRFCVSAAHTQQMLDSVVEIFSEIGHDIAIRCSKKKIKVEEIHYYEDSDEEV